MIASFSPLPDAFVPINAGSNGYLFPLERNNNMPTSIPSSPPAPFLPPLPATSELPRPAHAWISFLEALPLPLLLSPRLFLPQCPLTLQLLLRLLGTHFGLLQVVLPAGVGAFLALLAVGAEAGEIVAADAVFSDVLLSAAGSKGAEAAVVVGAGRAFGLGVDVQVEAVVAVGAGQVSGVVVAFGHPSQVVFVKELAGFTFFAKAAEPVLADEAAVEGAVVWVKSAR